MSAIIYLKSSQLNVIIATKRKPKYKYISNGSHSVEFLSWHLAWDNSLTRAATIKTQA